jgi:hypothetical protein
VSGSSPKCQLGAEDGVDKPLPRSSLRPRGLVMALQDSTRVGGSNNGSCIMLKGGGTRIDCCANVRELLNLLEEAEMERTKDHLAHKLALEHGVLDA